MTKYHSFGHFLLVIFLFSTNLYSTKGNARNIKLVAMNGNQYWVSSSSPYAPLLNFHLAYQYCRTLGLQLVTLENKEEVDIIATYLNTLEGNRNTGSTIGVGLGLKYWTSANKLGSESSWIWMSSGEQLNGTFSEYWLNRQNQISSNSAPKRQCMSMRATSSQRTIFSPEECNQGLPFICEQVRCIYYNYPVYPFPPESDNSSSEGEFRTANSDLNLESVNLASAASSSILTSSSPDQSRQFQSPSETSLRAQHYITSTNTLAFLASQAHHHDGPGNSVRRRITLKPSVTLKGPDIDKYLSYQHPVFRHSLRTSISNSFSTTQQPTTTLVSVVPIPISKNIAVHRNSTITISNSSTSQNEELWKPLPTPTSSSNTTNTTTQFSNKTLYYENQTHIPPVPVYISKFSNSTEPESESREDPDEFWRKAQSEIDTETEIRQSSTNSNPVGIIQEIDQNIKESTTLSPTTTIGTTTSSSTSSTSENYNLSSQDTITTTTDTIYVNINNQNYPSASPPGPGSSVYGSGFGGYSYSQAASAQKFIGLQNQSQNNQNQNNQDKNNSESSVSDERADPSEPKESKVKFSPLRNNSRFTNFSERIRTFQFHRSNSPISWSNTNKRVVKNREE